MNGLENNKIFRFSPLYRFRFLGVFYLPKKKKMLMTGSEMECGSYLILVQKKKYKDEIKNMYNGEQMVERLTEYVENRLTELGKNRIQKSIYKI
jgi:hypothetical protein